MSWLSKNYEKAALGGAAVVALGLAFFGWTKVNKVESDFATVLKGSGNNDPSVKEADKVAKARASLTTPRVWDQAETADGRAVDLFTGIPLFVGRATGAKPVDLVKGEPVHPPVPNAWWLQYRIDPGFADSPQRDQDEDGFSNLEEFEAKTDPTNAKQFPSLINKLAYLRDESIWWVLRPGFESEGGFTFKYDDAQKQTNQATAAAIILPNGLFFAEGVQKNRFKLLGKEVRAVPNKALGANENIDFVRIEDQRPNKKGRIYEIRAQFPERERANYVNYDRTAVLKLNVPGGSEFKIEENTQFALPPDAATKDYLLKAVTPEGIEVEYKDADGATKTLQIPKG